MSTVINLRPINRIKTICINTDSKGTNGLFAGNTWTYQTLFFNNVFNYNFNLQTTTSLTGPVSFTSINSINNSIFDDKTRKIYLILLNTKKSRLLQTSKSFKRDALKKI